MAFNVRQAVTAAALLAVSNAYAAVGDTVRYSFDTPSIGGGVASVSQAVLLLTETTNGVDFVLTPNWSQTTGNFVQQLVFAFSGDAFTFVDGAGPDALSMGTDSGSIDANYSIGPIVEMKWATSGGDKFDASHASSAWSFNGVGITLADFMVLVTSSSMPSPAFGVISMPGAQPAKWVASEGDTTMVPEVSTYAMFALGLGLMGAALGRRRSA